jgi:4-diphosphocytidyl-2-C-methyl-D-erythritol kinase
METASRSGASLNERTSSGSAREFSRHGSPPIVIVRRQGDPWTIDAPAKVNLHLEVLGKRPDGYHELESLMVSVSLYDTLEFRSAAAGETIVRSSDPRLDDGPGNLVVRAVELVRRESGRDDGVSIELTKRIPLAAGLAGGSTDAAAALAGLNLCWGLQWSKEKLADLGAQLGSDVPFFFYAPAAIARGRGEKLTELALPTAIHLVLICPAQGLSTAEVFRRMTIPQTPRSIAPMAAALAAGDVRETGRLLFNRLEEASLVLSPEVAAIQRDASSWNCLGHLMSGSGSTYFALCASAKDARSLRDRLQKERQDSVFVVQSSL